MNSNPEQPQVIDLAQRDRHLSTGVDQGAAGDGIGNDDALRKLLGATNAAMALLLSGQDVRKAAPVVGTRREEREL